MHLFKFDAGSRSTFFQIQKEMQSKGITYYVSQRGTDIIFVWNETTPPQFITDRFGWENECKLVGANPSLPDVSQNDAGFEVKVPWSPFKMSVDQKQVLMTRIEGLVKNPQEANMATRTGSFDLEIIIKVAPDDEAVFTPEVLATLTREVAEATGIHSPIIYLDGHMPTEMMSYLATAV